MVPENLSSSGLGGGQAMPGKEPSPSERHSLQSSPPRSFPWATTRSEAGEMEGEADRTGGPALGNVQCRGLRGSRNLDGWKHAGAEVR